MTDVALTPNAREVLERRYLLRDTDGNRIETPEEMFRRVAGDIAGAEPEWGGSPDPWEDLFYGIMARLDFLPNSPTMMNAGRDLQQLAACFVLPIEDSLDSIFDTLKHAAKIHQSGGGTGFSFSRLRPRGDMVKTTRGVSSGPVSFLEVYDSATEHIKQGSFRRGANMGILDVTHPDIDAFIDAKRDGGITNFNLSVAVTVDWMEKAERGEDYTIVNPRQRPSGGDAERRRGFRPDGRRRMVDGRSRRRVPRPDEPAPHQPDTGIGTHRGNQPVWRATPAAVRGLCSRVHQSRQLRNS